MAHMIEKDFNTSFNNVSIFPELGIETQIVHYIFCTLVWSVTVAVVQKIRLENRRQQFGAQPICRSASERMLASKSFS